MIPFPPEQITNLHRLLPEIVLCAFGMLIMLIDAFLPAAKRRVLGWIGFAGTVAALVAVYVTAHHTGPAYSSLILNDHFSVFVHAIVIGAAALAILGSIDYLEGEGIQRGEYYALVLFAAAGMGILAGANELLTAFVGLEMSSISSYILARIPPPRAQVQRILAQIFHPWLVCHRILSVRYCDGVRRHRHHAA